MAVPKGRISKSKRGMRRSSSFRIAVANLVVCGKCGTLMRTHRVCKSCGSYNKREVLKVADAK